MMTTILSFINAIILTTISAIHFYWMFGGKWGVAQSLPTTIEGKRVLNPKTLDCAIVAIIFLLMAILFLNFAGIEVIKFPNWILKYGVWVLSAIFLFRAIGDFKFVGFTKTIKSTEFAQLDSKFYAPLCLFLSITCFIISYLK